MLVAEHHVTWSVLFKVPFKDTPIANDQAAVENIERNYTKHWTTNVITVFLWSFYLTGC